MKSVFFACIALGTLLLTSCSFAADFMPPNEAARHVAAGTAVLVDVREPAEWSATGVAEPAILLSLSDLRGDRTQWKPFLEQNKDKELILYCRSGNRSGIAAGILAKEGYTVANAGAFKTWAAAGLPTRKVESN
ncbi:MAG: rhodanese-like domain-containing protein [Cephaloticoccus sp.]|nr:rhodanese-like domain-containing protein [Cephaloticoccus sp.]MCF7761216.1 rhodanese-like domain-containing protein [Cephaloticoccus sp.]